MWMNVSLLMTLLIVGVFLAVVWGGARLILGGLAWMFRGFQPRRSYRGAGGLICPNRQCRYVNSEGANFCAQCGASLRVSSTPGF